MADKVSVEFGADVSGFKSGIDQANDALDTINGHIESAKSAFSELAAVTAGALSLEGLKSSFDSLATYAGNIQNMQSTIGGSLESLTTLSGVAAMTGVSFGSLTEAVGRANLKVQESARDAYGPAAQGLKSLGLAARDLMGLPADQWLEKVTDAVSRFRPSLTLTSNVQQAFGAGMAQLMPVLNQGSDHFREMKAAVKQAQDGLSALLPGISETSDKLTLLGLRSRTFAAQIFTVLKPGIDAAIDAFSNLTQKITADDIRNVAKTIADGLIDIAASIARFFVQAGVTVDAFKEKLDSGFKLDLNLGSIDGPAETFLGWMAKISGNYDRLKDTLAKPISLDFNTPANFADRFAPAAAALKSQLKSIEDGAKSAHEWIEKAFSNPPKTEQPDGRPDAKPADNGIKDRASAQIEAVNAQLALAESAYQEQAQHIESLTKTFQLNEGQKTQALLAALSARETAEREALAAESEINGLSQKQWQKLLDDQTKLEAKATADRQKILDQALQEQVKSWNSVLQPIQSAWDGQLQKLLSGTETFAAAMKNVFSSLALDAIKELEKIALEKLALGLANSVGGPMNLISSALGAGSGTAGAAAQTAASTANTTALTALTAGVTADTTAQTAVATAQTALTTAFSGIGTALTTAMAALTAAVTANTTADTLNSVSKLVPSFDTGSWSLPGNTLAMVHAGEMIVPAGPAQMLRGAWSGGGSGGGGGGGTTNVGISMNLSSFNPSGMQATLSSMMPQLSRMLQKYQTLNPSTR